MFYHLFDKIRVFALAGTLVLMLLVLMILGVALSCFNTIAALVPYLFPRLIIAAYRLTHREDFQTDGGSDK